MSADRLFTSYARITPARNAVSLEMAGEESPGTMTATTAAPLPVTYHSTSVQTQPLRDGYQFQEIYGREPTLKDIAFRIGTAAIGRYEKDPGRNQYELAYGTPFPAAVPKGEGVTYVDSGYQTSEYSDCKRALAKAKVKASMIANKHRRAAEEAGYKVWAESKDEMVIHSEQFTVKVELDSDGNVKDGDLGSLFLPNIFGEEIEPRLAVPNAVLQPSLEMPHKYDSHAPNVRFRGYTVTSQNLTPPMTPALLPQGEIRPIAALAPSLRVLDPNPEPTEDYGEEYFEEDWDEGNESKLINASGRSDEVPPPMFVVYDATMSAQAAPPDLSTATVLSSSKQNDCGRPDDSHDQSPLQRSRNSISHSTDKPPDMEPVDQSDFDERRRSDYRRSSAYEMSRARESAAQLVAETSSYLRTEDIPRGLKKDRIRDSLAGSRNNQVTTESHRRSISPNPRGRDRSDRSRSPVRQEDEAFRRDARRRSEDKEAARREQQISNLTISKRPIDQIHEKGSNHDEREKRETADWQDAVPRTQPRIRREDMGRWKPSAKERYDAQQEIDRKSKEDEMKRAREAEDRRRLQHHNEDVGITTRRRRRKPSLDSHRPPMKEAKESYKTDVEMTEAEDGEDDMTRARRAEDRRRELHNAMKNPEVPTRHDRKDRIDKDESSRKKNDERQRKIEADAARRAAKPRPRRAVRDQINRWLGG